MKISKKLLTLALAAMLLLSLAAPAMAADSDFEIVEWMNGMSVLTEYHGPGGDVVIPNGVDCIGFEVFFDLTGVTSVTIPEGVIGIWQYAFCSCTDLKSVTIPESVTKIQMYAFDSCTSLTDVKIPSGVTVIPEGGFNQCISLKSITIPEGVTEIEDYAFSGCTGLKTVTIPASVTGIWEAFTGCTGLTDVYFGGTKEQWESIEKENDEPIFSDSPNVTIHYNSTGPDASTTPEQPTTPTTPKVQLSSQPLTVDGKAVSAQAYNIGGSNFFKLRDVAMMLNGTAFQFSVGYDAATRAVTATSGEAYTAAGGELTAGEDKSASCVVSDQSISVNGVKLEVTVYNIGGSNYFMLRDLGEALGFGVAYDNATRTVLVTTK